MKKVLYSFPAKLSSFLLCAASITVGGVNLLIVLLSRFVYTEEHLTTTYWFETVYSDATIAFWKDCAVSSARLITACVFLLLGLVSLVHLCVTAGRSTDRTEVRKSFIDRIPLELILGAALGLGISLLYAVFSVGLYLTSPEQMLIVFYLTAAVYALLLVLITVTLAVRIKAGQWWRGTLAYLAVWRLLRWFWKVLRVGVKALPLVWKGVGATALYGILSCSCVLYMARGDCRYSGAVCFFGTILLSAAALGGMWYFLWQLRQLQKGTERIAAGDLNYQVDESKLILDCKQQAQTLNRLREGMNAAVEARIQSERFRTELITNVSHDLKTPLTSICSYVDLLGKLDLQNDEAKEYVEVLSRQAARLTRLTGDLVEASKASTGSMEVRIAPTDVSELVRQSAGEYEERFKAANLTPVVSVPEQPVIRPADGRLLWRVLDNLLSNALKYSLSGTRVYLTLEENALTVRNISREPILLSPAELTERFVRGDASRSTEGSGLGLSIARSLMELMGGALYVDTDGDLFKATALLTKTVTGK